MIPRITFRSPVQKPLVRSNVAVPVGDRSRFRVTQRFADPDFYWRNIDPARAALGHRAVDIGDFGCGSTIVAMADGTAWRIHDNAASLPGVPAGTTNALGVAIDHGSGAMSQYWHLGGWFIPAGQSHVVAGQPIGVVGATGLGAVCHCHITLTLNGLLIDPEPHMFGEPLVIGEDVPMYDPANVFNLYGTGVRALPGANIRSGPDTAQPVIANFPQGYAPLRGVAKVKGGMANGLPEWWAVWIEVEGKTRIAYVHTSAAELIPAPAGGVSSEELAKVQKAANDAGRIEGRARAAKAAAEAVLT